MRQTCVRVWRACVILGVGLTFSAGLSAQTEKVLYSFTKGLDGGFPYGGLVSDGKGNYYGTAFQGGTTGAGVVFELSPTTGGAWTQHVIYNFAGYTNLSDGLQPTSALIFESKGNLYGVTEGGGLINPST